MGQRASLWGGGWPHGRARAFEHAGGTAASGPRSSRVSPRPTVGASEPSMPLDLRRPSTPTMGMIANSAFTSRGRSSRGEPPAAAAAGAHLFSGLATASSGEAMSGAAREGRTAERLIGLAGAKPSAAPTASNMVARKDPAASCAREQIPPTCVRSSASLLSALRNLADHTGQSTHTATRIFRPRPPQCSLVDAPFTNPSRLSVLVGIK